MLKLVGRSFLLWIHVRRVLKQISNFYFFSSNSFLRIVTAHFFTDLICFILCRIYIASINPEVDGSDLRSLFSTFGEMKSSDFYSDSSKVAVGQYRNYGFISEYKVYVSVYFIWTFLCQGSENKNEFKHTQTHQNTLFCRGPFLPR